MRISVSYSVFMYLTIVRADEFDQQVTRLRSNTDVKSASTWWKSIRSNSLVSVKEMTSLKGRTIAFVSEGDEVDGFFKSLAAGQQSMTATPSSSPSVSVMPSSNPSDVIPLGTESPSEPLQSSNEPSFYPSDFPTRLPTLTPTKQPNFSPTGSPSSFPSDFPTEKFSFAPSLLPSVEPSVHPSEAPTITPSKGPSIAPSLRPSVEPSSNPSEEPSIAPSSRPSGEPSNAPTGFPSAFPTISSAPSMLPTLEVCRVSPQERIRAILAILDQVADSQLIRDPSTPQGQATEWILNVDDLACPTDPKLIQRWALAVFYFSTEGDGWVLCSDGDICNVPPFEGDSAFLSDVNECGWAGIRCNTNGCVTDIKFERNGLAGTIPTELALLTSLAYLEMEEGETTGTIPSELGSLSNLYFLDLDFNRLTGSIPSEIYQLTLLDTLDLNDNQLTGIIDSAIGNLLLLDFFQIHNNQFIGTIPSEIGNLSLLSVFTMYDNFLVGEMPQEICDLRPTPLQFLIADCGGLNPRIFCDLSCCSSCRRT
ncbi:two component regulator [Nitzschia inconspicua]|uniref:Two component regulator n=1 Tax=Nitzschia inconspicua TaxID=303405 RepID=A0A9K3PCH1_9STRA|nr:two component regulator [Nitzschia inconspicua]